MEMYDFLITKKKKIAMGILSLFLLIMAYKMTYNIRPGEVGVVVNLLREDTAIESKELKVGLHIIAPWRDVYKFPIFEQNHQWTQEDAFVFQTSEGLSVSADIGITYHLEADKIHELFCKFRRGMEEITHIFIKNHIRDAINKVSSRMKIEDIYGEKKEEFFSEVHKFVSTELEPLGFQISHIFIIGKFVVPNIVMEALDRKIEATQRAQQRENELRESEAQAKKEIAQAHGVGKSQIIAAKAAAESIMIEANAKAAANKLLSSSLNEEVLKWHSIHKWDGKLPAVMGNEHTPLLINPHSFQDNSK